MCGKTWSFFIERRDNMFYTMYGEVYGYMEYSQQVIHYSDTAGARETGRFGGYVLGTDLKRDEPGAVQYCVARLAYRKVGGPLYDRCVEHNIKSPRITVRWI